MKKSIWAITLNVAETVRESKQSLINYYLEVENLAKGEINEYD